MMNCEAQGNMVVYLVLALRSCIPHIGFKARPTSKLSTAVEIGEGVTVMASTNSKRDIAAGDVIGAQTSSLQEPFEGRDFSVIYRPFR